MGNDSLPMFSDMVKQHGGSDGIGGMKVDKLNPLEGLIKKKQTDFPTTMICSGPICLLGYEDGLICCWDIESGNFVFPMIGHTNRVNHLVASDD